MPVSRPKPPSGLAPTGRALWRRVVGDLDESMEFDQRELAVLSAACRQADDVAALERAIKRDGHIVIGAAGQPRLNGAVVEARQGRLSLARLLGDIDLPAQSQAPQTVDSKRARRAADVRWAEHRARRVAAVARPRRDAEPAEAVRDPEWEFRALARYLRANDGGRAGDISRQITERGRAIAARRIAPAEALSELWAFLDALGLHEGAERHVALLAKGPGPVADRPSEESNPEERTHDV